MAETFVRCTVCGPIGVGTGFSSGANAAIAHGNETGHMVISEPAAPVPHPAAADPSDGGMGVGDSCPCTPENGTYPVDVDCPLHGLAAVGPDPRDAHRTAMSDQPTPTVPDPTVEARIAEVLGEHRWFGPGCTGCDWISDDPSKSLKDDHRAHQARILAEHTERAVREALEAAAVRVEADRDAYCKPNTFLKAFLNHGEIPAAHRWLSRAARIVRAGGRP